MEKEFIEHLEDKLCVINNLLNTEQDEAKVYYLIVRRQHLMRFYQNIKK